MSDTSCFLPSMPRAGLTIFLALLAAPASALAQAAPAPDPQILAKYDANKNGRLDADELVALQADDAKAAVISTASVSGARSGGAEEVVQMSPFEVSSGNDKGYYAANTLSGTRLNSKLEDLGSSITVVTKQQMEDFALVDVNDIFMYEAGTEGTATFTNVTVDRYGGVIDGVQNDPNNSNRIRGITSANQSRGNFATSGRVPLDPIDMDAVEISRGPNSTIFGLGNASGTVNIIPSTASLQRSISNVATRVDSLGSTRETIDLSRPLITNKLAVRANAAFQQSKFQRKPSLERSKRYNGMVTYKPFSATTLRASIQYYEVFARRPNSVLPHDGFSYWEQNGRPTWDAAAGTITRNGVTTPVAWTADQATVTNALGAGLESGGTSLDAFPSLFVNPDGSIGAWTPGRRTGFNATLGYATIDYQSSNSRLVESQPLPQQGPLYAATPSITDKSRYDWSSINVAAPNWQQTRNRTFNVQLEQFFLRTSRNLVGLQLGWNREESDRFNQNTIGQGGSSPMIVYIDVNTTFPDGTQNPYFGRPYLSAANPSGSRQPWFRDTFQAQLAYQLTLSREPNWMKWLGDHSLSGYGEYKNTISAGFNYAPAIVDPHAWITAGRTHTVGYYRYYVGDAKGDDIDYSPTNWRLPSGTHNLHWYNGTQWVDEPATIGQAYQGSARQSRNIIKTGGVVMQNHFLKDRIVTTFGLRKDENFNRTSDIAPIAADGINPNLGPMRNWSTNWLRRDGRTETRGVVAKPLRGWRWADRMSEAGGVRGFLADTARSIDVFLNKSDSFVPSTIAHNLMGDVLPDPAGKGKEYGVSFSLFNDKLILRFGRYDNVQANSRAGDSGVIAQRASRIDFSATTGGSDNFNLYRNELSWVGNAHTDWTTAQIATEVARQMQLPEDFLADQNSLPISDTSDVSARGKEIEVNFNPNRYFRFKFNVTQQQSIDSRLSPAIMQYINMRMPIWQKIVDPTTGQPWWTSKYRGTSPLDFYTINVIGPYKLATANEGRTKTQIREWKANALGNLSLGAFVHQGWLQRVSVNGAMRWEDQASIGYYGVAGDPNSYDPNRPIWDKPHAYYDAGVTYTQRVFGNRALMRVQLQGRNITEGGRIQAVNAWPNGVPYMFRIVDPRQFILDVSFNL